MCYVDGTPWTERHSFCLFAFLFKFLITPKSQVYESQVILQCTSYMNTTLQIAPGCLVNHGRWPLWLSNSLIDPDSTFSIFHPKSQSPTPRPNQPTTNHLLIPSKQSSSASRFWSVMELFAETITSWELFLRPHLSGPLYNVTQVKGFAFMMMSTLLNESHLSLIWTIYDCHLRAEHQEPGAIWDFNISRPYLILRIRHEGLSLMYSRWSSVKKERSQVLRVLHSPYTITAMQ